MGFAFHVPPRHHERGFFSPRLGEVAERLKAPHFCAVYGRPYRRLESAPSPAIRSIWRPLRCAFAAYNYPAALRV